MQVTGKGNPMKVFQREKDMAKFTSYERSFQLLCQEDNMEASVKNRRKPLKRSLHDGFCWTRVLEEIRSGLETCFEGRGSVSGSDEREREGEVSTRRHQSFSLSSWVRKVWEDSLGTH